MSSVIFKNIVRLASERKITIAKIEQCGGLGNGTISKIEFGNPTISTIEKIAGVLECTVADLLAEEGK